MVPMSTASVLMLLHPYSFQANQPGSSSNHELDLTATRSLSSLLHDSLSYCVACDEHPSNAPQK